MEHTSEWTIRLFLDEHDDQTRAIARLQTGANEVTGIGMARRNPKDREVPEIGAELAAARALSDLGHKLFDAAVDDIEAITHQHAVVRP